MILLAVSTSCRGADCTQRGDGSPLETSSSLIAKEHTVTGQVKPIGQRGRPALLTGTIIHDVSTLLLVLPGNSISRYKEPNKKLKSAIALVFTSTHHSANASLFTPAHTSSVTQTVPLPSSLHTLPPLSPHKPPPSSPHKPPPSSPHAFERGSPEKVI